MTQRVLLLGDSIIDNGSYVKPGEPDVGRQIERILSEYNVVKRAVDGSVTREVLERQCHDLWARDIVILSSGGNDALGYKLEMLDATPTASPQGVLVALWEIRESFRKVYAALLDQLSPAAERVLVCTVYNPAFQFSGADASDQKAAESALSAFNDVIQQEARARRIDVLELRRIFIEPADFANPIEPSARGGEKLAAAIASWVRSRASR